MNPSEYELCHCLTESQIHQLLNMYHEEWWSKDRSLSDVRKMLSSGGKVFALVEPETDQLAAFARVLTDQTYLALILDVIVALPFRDSKLGSRLLESICSHPEIGSVQSLELVCQPELIAFYKQFGFQTEVGRSTLMRRTSATHLTDST